MIRNLNKLVDCPNCKNTISYTDEDIEIKDNCIVELDIDNIPGRAFYNADSFIDAIKKSYICYDTYKFILDKRKWITCPCCSNKIRIYDSNDFKEFCN
jgi:endogenous inhibitor of DNA gyrase (YacG/DUF329 family)